MLQMLRAESPVVPFAGTAFDAQLKAQDFSVQLQATQKELEREKDSGSVASDGVYLYVHGPNGLSKIGTGYNGSVAGKGVCAM